MKQADVARAEFTDVVTAPTPMKLAPVILKGVTFYQFYCPACQCLHMFEVRSDGCQPTWRFDGDMEAPTFTPALKNHVRGCHLTLENGVIHYLPSSLHEYRNMRVMLPALGHDEL